MRRIAVRAAWPLLVAMLTMLCPAVTASGSVPRRHFNPNAEHEVYLPSEHERPRRIVMGISNRSRQRHMNQLLQSLNACTYFGEYMRYASEFAYGDHYGDRLGNAIRALYGEMWRSTKVSTNPALMVEVNNALGDAISKYRHTVEEDVNAILNDIVEIMRSSHRGQHTDLDAFVGRAFGYEFHGIRTCAHCSRTMHQPYHVAFQMMCPGSSSQQYWQRPTVTFDDCMAYTLQKVVQDRSCRQCNATVLGADGQPTGKVSLTLSELPPIFPIHLRRISSHREAAANILVDFPFEVDFAKFMLPVDRFDRFGRRKETRYVLKAVIQHKGGSPSMEAGVCQFAAKVSNPNPTRWDEEWLHVSDTTVAALPADWRQVLSSRVVRKEAVMLFYQRIDL